jgi:threonine dehydratase
MTSLAPRALAAPTLEEIRAARERIKGVAVRTPLVKLHVDAPAEIWLKLENLQPIGSFKLRGATNAMRLLPRERLERGVYTASAGNMAQGVAWAARMLGVRCDVVVPEHAPQTKLAAIERLGAGTTRLPFDEWWRVLVEHAYEPMNDRAFIHPVSDPAVVAGNGTIGLEIVEDLPEVETIIVPYGGGGLSAGIAGAVRALRPGVAVFAAEVETAAPLAASLAAGAPQVGVPYTASFVDGIGASGVLVEMWPLASTLLAGSLVSSLAEVAAAVRLLAGRARVVAEGAGAAAVAAAVAGRAGGGKVVCIVSGGNIDLAKLALILEGGVP